MSGLEYREYSFRYSYTGREFTSIWGYLISNGIDEYWYTEDDVLEMMPQAMQTSFATLDYGQYLILLLIFIHHLFVNFMHHSYSIQNQRIIPNQQSLA
jgi:hypothetical protein